MSVRETIQRRLDERAAVDRREAQADLVSGVLYTGLSFAFAHAVAIGLAFLVRGPLYLLFHPYLTILVVSSVTTVILAIDVWLHPEESGVYRPEYRMKSGALAGREVMPLLEHQKGALSGMPLMANVSDPANLVEHTRAQASGMASFLLCGPRLLLKAKRGYAGIAARSTPEAIALLERLAGTLGAQGLTTEDIDARASADPELGAGFALARRIKLIVQGVADRRWTIRS